MVITTLDPLCSLTVTGSFTLEGFLQDPGLGVNLILVPGGKWAFMSSTGY